MADPQDTLRQATGHHRQGQLDEAEALYRQILDRDPDHADANHMLGVAACQRGNFQNGAQLIGKAIEISPKDAVFHNNLGNALKELGRLDEATASYAAALDIDPGLADAHYNSGNILKDRDQPEDAAKCYERALAIKPDYVEARSNLGNVLKALGRLSEAVACYEAVLRARPDLAEVHYNLGNTLKDQGLPEGAIEHYQQAIAIKPDYIEAQSNLLMAMQYRPGITAAELHRLHLEWDRRFGEPLRSTWRAHDNARDPEKTLKVGLVSPDLGQHPVGYFLILLLENMPESGGIEFFGYSDRDPDAMTERLRAATGGWRDIRGMSDDDLAGHIGADHIDIAFDLTGHTNKNRLLVFARKPAPVQVSWGIGYPGTTGLGAIDYLLTDVHHAPLGAEDFYSEKILRLPDGKFCYEPPSFAPDVGPLPLQHNDFVTFASFSNPAKINAKVLEIWTKILTAVPGSRLVIKYKGVDLSPNRERFVAALKAAGLDEDRLNLEGAATHADMMARYNDIDIGLDTFPYNGGLTTCEALWMGVPVITLVGDTFAGRHSLSHLSTVGLSELVATDEDRYRNLAVDLAGDPKRLAGLRAGLRKHMAASPLCDGPAFAGNFAATLRGAWQTWCASENS
ncbi:MAG: tetratricopeptide repeat protein [Proteobacteria bacterium]|nr:tetratricopeptide repeat protein [Pseudomonadota bacterium]